MTYNVEGVTWLLSTSWKLHQIIYLLGLISHSCYRMVRTMVTGENNLNLPVPARIIHTGIVFHGHVYEYCDSGVRKTMATSEGDPGSVCSVDNLLERRILGTSRMSRSEFDTWIAEQKEGRFRKDKYSVVDNQCCHFTIESANFLGVEYPDEWRFMCEYTEQNATIVQLAAGSTGSSTSPSTSEFA